MKKVMVTFISLATLGLGIVVPLQANAQSMSRTTGVSSQYQRQHQYRVQYHGRHQTKWINAGTYRNRTDAQREVQKLQRQGYYTRLVTL